MSFSHIKAQEMADFWPTMGDQAISAVGDLPPVKHCLDKIYPNPFNPSVTIGFAVAEPAQVSLIIYDLKGRKVRTLVQGVLSDDTGNRLDGNFDLTFTVYPDPDDATVVLWSELIPAVEVHDGLFHVVLGYNTPMPPSLFETDALWMGVAVNDDSEMEPRMRLTSSPWSAWSAVADTALAGGGTGDSDADWIISGANMYAGAVLGMGERGENDLPVALSGRVWVRCTADGQAIKPGDLLTTSQLPGMAMKASDPDRTYGAVIGKAMTRLEAGEGLVLVLVNLQ